VQGNVMFRGSDAKLKLDFGITECWPNQDVRNLLSVDIMERIRRFKNRARVGWGGHRVNYVKLKTIEYRTLASLTLEISG
jgi:hypothetical protein